MAKNMTEYDPEFWKYGTKVTVGQFCDYVKANIPLDALLCVCGEKQLYFHFTVDGAVFFIDNDSLADLPEYINCEAGKF